MSTDAAVLPENPIAAADSEVWRLIAAETERQEHTLEMIASENHASPAVMAATGSCMTNKYCEGYPGKRYYSGCRFYDDVETLAIERAKELFGCSYANVQPPSVRSIAANISPGSNSANCTAKLAFAPECG